MAETQIFETFEEKQYGQPFDCDVQYTVSKKWRISVAREDTAVNNGK
jgi:hypothetical protein